MIKVYQDKFESESEDGNCLQACVASIMEVDIADVPHFASYGDEWFHKFTKWGLENDFLILCIDSWPPPEVYAIMCGKSPRGDFSHAVVSCPDGEIHDPHPSGSGLDGLVRWCYLFIPIDPTILKK